CTASSGTACGTRRSTSPKRKRVNPLLTLRAPTERFRNRGAGMRFHLTIAVALLGGAVLAAGPKRNFADAPLLAITFLNQREGWAVGDDGVILQTIDGGRTWESQDSGTRASLRAVQFLTPFTGWVAGREELPNGGGSSGVLLFTSDGGLKWTRVAAGVMP